MASALIRPPESDNAARFYFLSLPGNPDSTQPKSALINGLWAIEPSRRRRETLCRTERAGSPALVVSSEDEDNRIYRSFADGLRASYPDTAAMYDEMAAEEIGHQASIRRSPR
jgi:Rubrerythrin